LEIDEWNAPAHNALADIKKGYDWDLVGAEAEYQSALQLSPSHLLTHLWYAECLSRMERHEEALRESAHALSLDPASSGSRVNRAMLLFRARHYEAAIDESQRVLDLDPSQVNAYWWRGLSFAGKGEISNSIDCFARGAEMTDAPLFRALLGHVYGLGGDSGKACRILEDLATESTRRFVSPMDFAIVYAGLGNANSAFHWLEAAYQVRAARIHELSWSYFDRFRTDARYSDLQRRIGLPQ
jgi:tetratricopeptide (TPR) repeat protein